MMQLFFRWLVDFLFMRRLNYKWFYSYYMRSPQWMAKRLRVIRRAGYRCQRCKRSGLPLEVHHRTYARFGWEWLSDLQALCHGCHRKAGAERKEVR